MNRRLGEALAKHILRLEGDHKFVLVEGISEELALAMASGWDDTQLRLAIASTTPARFGSRALVGVSGTSLRNHGPVCLAICEGAKLADRQSLRSFASVAPSDLLAGHPGLTLLAQSGAPAPLDGLARHVRQAILQADAAARPSAASVAAYFDRCATGEDPLKALPALGAFADHAAGESVDARRILANLMLAARRRTDATPRPADLRRRAERVLAQKPGLSSGEIREFASRVVRLLQTGDDELLSLITYDEALDILEQKSSDLPVAVRRELLFYQQVREDDETIPWERYFEAAASLKEIERQKQAARELLEFDQIERGAVFDVKTRRRLDQLLKDSVIVAHNPSCPEFALLRCARALGGIGAIELVAPIRASGAQRQNRQGAVQEIALSCARLRLGRPLRYLEAEGVLVDGALLLSATPPLGVFEDAQLARIVHEAGWRALLLQRAIGT